MTSLQNQLREKIQEINDMEGYLNELKSENARLQSEMESSIANERLLAAMESDKVAAARAVAQNQKLKQQLLELEGGFVKLVTKVVFKFVFFFTNFNYINILESRKIGANRSVSTRKTH